MGCPYMKARTHDTDVEGLLSRSPETTYTFHPKQITTRMAECFEKFIRDSLFQQTYKNSCSSITALDDQQVSSSR